MRKWFCIAFVFLGLAACAGTGPSLSQGMKSCYASVTSANELAQVAFQNEKITIEEFCTVTEWSKVGLEACDQAVEQWAKGQPQTALQHLNAASLAIDGISQEAKRRGEWSCKRQEFN